MKLLDFIEDVIDSLSGPGPKRNAPRTPCCNVLMWDLWMHAPNCPGDKQVKSPSDPRPK